MITALLPSLASIASLRGRRKFRPYPSATFTTSPRDPNFATSSLRMTSMDDSGFDQISGAVMANYR